MNRRASMFPSWHHRREAQARQRAASNKQEVAERSIRCCEASADREDGVVFQLRGRGKPLLRLRAIALALRGGDARRGIFLDSNSFTPSVARDYENSPFFLDKCPIRSCLSDETFVPQKRTQATIVTLLFKRYYAAPNE